MYQPFISYEEACLLKKNVFVKMIKKINAKIKCRALALWSSAVSWLSGRNL